MLIYRDDCPPDPRDNDKFSHMYCWSNRYDLGDPHDYKEPEDFLRGHLIKEYVRMAEIRELIQKGRTNLTLKKNSASSVELRKRDSDELIVKANTVDELFRDVFKPKITDALDSSYLALLENAQDFVLLPVFLKDRIKGYNSISLSVSDSGEPQNFEQIGWIYTTKQEFFEEYDYLYYSEKDWRHTAVQKLTEEVEKYTHYLNGEVYWTELFRLNEKSEWESAKNRCLFLCPVFYGSNILENGICESCQGLLEAIQSGQYETGTAKRRLKSVVKWHFDPQSRISAL